MKDYDPPTPVETRERKRIKIILLIILVILIAVAAYLYWAFNPNRPTDYADIQEHFKYGSIGSEPANVIPYWIFKVLPDMFPEKLTGKGYAALGLIEEPGRDLPSGF